MLIKISKFKFFYEFLVISILFSTVSYAQEFWKLIPSSKLPQILSTIMYRDSLIIATNSGLFYYNENKDSISAMSEEIFKNVYCSNLYVNNDKLYVVCSEGVYRNGVKWEKIISNPNSSFECVLASNDTIFVGAYEKIYYSYDYGLNWNTYDNTSDIFTYKNIWTIFRSKKGKIFAGTSCGLISLSSDNTWQELESFTCGDVLSFAENKNGDLYLGGADRFQGIYKSSDEGITWNKVFTPNPNDQYSLTTFSIIVDTSNRVLFTSNNPGGGIFVSTNNDSTYEKNNSGLINDGIGGLAINSSGILFASTYYGNENYIYKSSNSITNIKYGEEITKKFILEQNYPNPFNPTTKIIYSIPINSKVQLEVYNILGQKVEELINENQNAGTYSIDFENKNLPSGIYVYKLSTKTNQISKKMLILK